MLCSETSWWENELTLLDVFYHNIIVLFPCVKINRKGQCAGIVWFARYFFWLNSPHNSWEIFSFLLGGVTTFKRKVPQFMRLKTEIFKDTWVNRLREIDVAKFCLWRTFHLYTQKVCYIFWAVLANCTRASNYLLGWVLCHGSPLQIVVKCLGQQNRRCIITEINHLLMIDFW